MTPLNYSRLRCPILRNPPSLFFSLVDYRNSLFTSNNPSDVIKFYDGFHNRDDLIEWMRERPKGASYLHEIEGDKNIIVVIPTADFSGKFAKECRENIFKGLHIIFVESGEIPDFYFNYAHNCNVGIKRAMEYNPKWIVISNDDMYKVDSFNTLKSELSKVDNEDISVVFTKPSRFHSKPSKFAEINNMFRLLLLITNQKEGKKRLGLYKKFSIKFNSFSTPFLSALFHKKGYAFMEILDFLIISGKFIRKENEDLFDETFINGREDVDLSLRFRLNREKRTFIDYKIGDYMGSSLGNDSCRFLRDIANLTYLNFKL